MRAGDRQTDRHKKDRQTETERYRDGTRQTDIERMSLGTVQQT